MPMHALCVFRLDKIIDTGKACHSYITNEDGINVGCQFQLQKSLKDQTELLIVVTDKLKNIKPFTLFKRVNSIGTFWVFFLANITFFEWVYSKI